MFMRLYAARSLLSKLGRFIQPVSNHAPHHNLGSDRRIEIAFVILMDDTVFNHARRLEKVLWDQLGLDTGLRASPHLSLKLGFYINTSQIELFGDYLNNLASETMAFEIQVGRVEAFPEGVIFLDVKPNLRLEDLRQKILVNLSERFGIEPNRYEGEQFHFHLTLAHGLSKPDIALAHQALEKFPFEHGFALDTLALLIHLEDGWTTYKRVRLPKRSDASAHQE